MANVRFEAEGPIAIVTIDRPGVRNAVDRATADELTAAAERFEHDPSLSVLVLTGAGGTFCAGADLKAVASGSLNRVDPDGDGPLGPTRRMLSKPSIAAVEGYAVAGGLELALWCDLRVASSTAKFGVFCRRWGVPLIDGGTVRLPRLIGASRAMDLILTGREASGAEAFEMGLANRVCEPGQALPTAMALARELAALPQECLRTDRLSAHEQWALPLPQALRNEAAHGARALQSRDLIEGLDRFTGGEGRHGAPARGAR